ADVAHPINSACREQIQQAVIDELEAELERCQQPGYRSRYDDDFADAGEEVETALIDPPHTTPKPKRSEDDAERPKRVADDEDGFGAGVF
ncbi:MAG: stage V sporulation protein G, partial [Planctomycetota bacterium]